VGKREETREKQEITSSNEGDALSLLYRITPLPLFYRILHTWLQLSQWQMGKNESEAN
jgi:hypothetical protein